MKVAIASIFAFLSLARGYTVQACTDDGCHENCKTFTGPDVYGPPGTVGNCTDIGFVAHSFFFIQDNDDYNWSMEFAGWPSNETCAANSNGLHNAPIKTSSANENFVTCTNLLTNNNPWPDGFTQFLAGQW